MAERERYFPQCPMPGLIARAIRRTLAAGRVMALLARSPTQATARGAGFELPTYRSASAPDRALRLRGWRTASLNPTMATLWRYAMPSARGTQAVESMPPREGCPYSAAAISFQRNLEHLARLEPDGRRGPDGDPIVPPVECGRERLAVEPPAGPSGRRPPRAASGRASGAAASRGPGGSSPTCRGRSATGRSSPSPPRP